MKPSPVEESDEHPDTSPPEIHAGRFGKRFAFLRRHAQYSSQPPTVDLPVKQQRQQQYCEAGIIAGQEPNELRSRVRNEGAGAEQASVGSAEYWRGGEVDPAQFVQAQGQQRIVKAVKARRRQRNDSAEDQADDGSDRRQQPPWHPEAYRKICRAKSGRADHRVGRQAKDARGAVDQHPAETDRSVDRERRSRGQQGVLNAERSEKRPQRQHQQSQQPPDRPLIDDGLLAPQRLGIVLAANAQHAAARRPVAQAIPRCAAMTWPFVIVAQTSDREELGFGFPCFAPDLLVAAEGNRRQFLDRPLRAPQE